MKKLILLFTFILFYSITIFAQDEYLDELEFGEQPLSEQKPPYFAIAGGYNGNFLFINVKDLNNHLKAKNFNFDEFKSPFFMSGAEGFVAIPFIPNVRIGFLGLGGSQTNKKDITISSVDYKQSIEFSFSYQGLLIDYAFVPMKSLAILPGLGIGWGNVQLEYSQTEKEFDWNNIQMSSVGNNFLNRLEATYSFLNPRINIEYALAPYLMFRLSGSYMWSFALTGDWKWKYNREADMKNVPKEINASGLNLQFGVYVGLFNY